MKRETAKPDDGDDLPASAPPKPTAPRMEMILGWTPKRSPKKARKPVTRKAKKKKKAKPRTKKSKAKKKKK